ncbi:hypothetical protein [Cellulosimicrobium funkei]|uniref:hypothetical protein n=1 Tax=Cellulosimicrobium funkei TaxID=264251 RepID=UPI0036BEB98E
MTTTPALARADARLYPLLPDQPETRMDFTRLAVSAALHDPDDPDWLVKVAEEHGSFLAGDEGCECECGVPITDTIEEYAVDRWRQHRADTVRAAILGGA